MHQFMVVLGIKSTSLLQNIPSCNTQVHIALIWQLKNTINDTLFTLSPLSASSLEKAPYAARLHHRQLISCFFFVMCGDATIFFSLAITQLCYVAMAICITTVL